MLAAALSSGGCRKAEDDGPLRARADAGLEDAGPRRAASCAELECAAPARCELDADGASCVCPLGYRGDPARCEDVDECEITGGNDCDENALCENEPGGYECTCLDGFVRSGRSCVQLSNCEGASNICHADATCSQEPEGVSCACRKGFFEGDGYLCRDVDECATGAASCGDVAHCENRREGYKCLCDDGFQGSPPGLPCESECALALADPARCAARGARCSIGPDAAASCTSCGPSYTGDGKRCDLNSECSALDCGENTRCIGAAGARTCACADGFEGNPREGCVDIDECQSGAASCDASNSTCSNLPGGYVCACLTGYEREDGACVNKDECARNTDLCDPAADCQDKTPGYACSCKPGYRGDGYACVDIDECNEGGDDCARDGTASCQNTRGGFECVCPKGYAGDPRSEACYCDLSGIWAVRQDATLEIPQRSVGDVVLIEGSTTRATIWELDRFDYDGANIRVERKGCGSDVLPEIYSPHFDEVYSSGVPNTTYDMLGLQSGGQWPLSRENALPGTLFMTPRAAAVQGIALNDPLNDAWPASTADVPNEAWVDDDQDGEPGITLWPASTTQPSRRNPSVDYSYLPVPEPGTALIEARVGCVSTALRAIGSLQARIETCGRISGKLISERAEGRVHSCTLLRKEDWDSYDVTCNRRDWSNASSCTQDQVKFLDEQNQNNTAGADFEMIKLGDLDAPDLDCAAVRDALPALTRQ